MSQVAELEAVGVADAAESLYEVVDGNRAEIPPMGAAAGVIASLLQIHLGSHSLTHGLGMSVVEVLFTLDPSRPLRRRPDLAFVSAARWPADLMPPERGAAWDVVPNLAVEVVSPTDLFVEVLVKVREYFAAGVELVWLIVPSEPLVYVYRSPTAVRIVDRTGALEGEAVVPGFRLALAELFGRSTPEAKGGDEPKG